MLQTTMANSQDRSEIPTWPTPYASLRRKLRALDERMKTDKELGLRLLKKAGILGEDGKPTAIYRS
jgi:hypothetical protein